MATESGGVFTGTYEFRCKNCGSPLDVSPETIVAVCSYCGYPNWIREDLKSEILIVPAMSESKILEKARERVSTDRDLKKIKNMISLGKPYLLYIPYYFAKASSGAEYWGRVRVRMRKCSGSGKNRSCSYYSRTVTVSGYYGPFQQYLYVIARRGVKAFTVNALGHYYLESKPKPVKLEEAKLTRSGTRRILGVEIDEKTAADILLDEHLDVLRDKVTDEIIREAKRKADMMYSGSVVGASIIEKRIKPMNIDLKVSRITLLPLYIIPYTYQNGVYRFFMSGWDGLTIVAEEPMNTLSRLSWGLGGALISGIMGGLAGPAIVMGGRTGIFIGLLLGIIGLTSSYYTFKMATRPVRVEVANEKFASVKGFFKKTKRVLDKFGETTTKNRPLDILTNLLLSS